MSSTKKILLVVILIILFSSLSVWLVYTKVDTYCILYQLLIILMPILTTRFLIDDIQVHFEKNRGAIGAFIGALTGLIPATMLSIVAVGTLESFTATSGEQINATSSNIYYLVSFSFVGIWVILMIISTLIGLIASIRPKKR